MEKNKKKNKKGLFWLGISSIIAIPVISIVVGSYFIIKNSYDDFINNNDGNNTKIQNNGVDNFIAIEAKSGLDEILPSEISKPDNISYLRSYLSYRIKPNIETTDILEKFDIDLEEVPNSADDFNGTIKVKMTSKYKRTETIAGEKEFIVSGFKSTKVGDIRFKTRINNALQNLSLTRLQELSSINHNSLTSENFLDYFTLDDAKFNIQTNSSTKTKEIILKENENYKAKIEVLNNTYNPITKKISIIFTLTHSSFPDYSYGKVITINNVSFKDEQEILNKKTILFNENVTDYFKLNKNANDIFPSVISAAKISNFNQIFNLNNNVNFNEFDFKILTQTLDDQDGNIDILITEKNSKIQKVFNFKVFNFNTISSKIFEFTKINKNYINKSYNIETKQDLVVSSLNSSDKTLRYETIGDKIQNFFESNEFKNRFSPFGVDYAKFFYSTSSKFEIFNKSLNFVIKNWNGDENRLYIPFEGNPSDKNNIAVDFPENGQIKSKEEILDDLKSRTLSIHYIVNDNAKTSRVISGTAWIFDKEKNTNTYYLATNIHVVSDLLKYKDKVSSFAYSYNSKYRSLPHINTPITPSGVSYSQVFRRFDRKINEPYAYNINKSPYITKEAEEFWKHLEIIPLGENSPEKGKYTDFALIKVTFPEDKVVRNIFNKPTYVEQFKPDQAKYYDEHKLNFLITDRIDFPKSANSENNLLPLPMELTFAGYLGGDEYVEVSQSPYLKYDNDSYRIQEIDNKQYTSLKENIHLPGIYSGHGMSGSLVLNQFGQVVGIFWGGYFGDENEKGLSFGTGIIDTISIKRNNQKTVLRKWLDQTKNIVTDLDDIDAKVKY
ncbi:DUF31 family putative serine protease [Mycoplasma sp. AC157]